jgi:hypothetical protein
MSSPYPSFYKYYRNRSSSDFDIEGDKWSSISTNPVEFMPKYIWF